VHVRCQRFFRGGDVKTAKFKTLIDSRGRQLPGKDGRAAARAGPRRNGRRLLPDVVRYDDGNVAVHRRRQSEQLLPDVVGHVA